MDNLSKLWHESKSGTAIQRPEGMEVLRKAKEREKSISLFHLGNLFILVLSLLVLCFYFFYYVQLQNWVSKVGSYLMLAGLFVRIVIEVISYLKFKKIDYVANVSTASDDAHGFYSFRKKVHGPLTIAIIILYVFGVGLLTPEVAIYIPMHWLIVMHSLFIVSGIIIIWKVRQGIKRELDNLSRLVDVRNQLHK